METNIVQFPQVVNADILQSSESVSEKPMTDMPIATLINGQAFTDSLVISEQTENSHQSVLKLIRNYKTDFEAFGGVGFEIRPFETTSGTQSREIALLNEHQACLLFTYMRNNDIVRRFKIALIKAFSELAKRENSSSDLQGSALVVIGQKMIVLENDVKKFKEENRSLKGEIYELNHEIEMMVKNSSFFFDVAAKLFDMGDKTLFKILRDKEILCLNNLPKETYQSRGYFTVAYGTETDKLGQKHISGRTKITGKGIHWVFGKLREWGFIKLDMQLNLSLIHNPT